MEGERFPQKPIDSNLSQLDWFSDDIEVSVEEIEDTPEMKQIAGYLEEINETAIKNILLQELRKSCGAVQTITRMARYIPTSKIEIEEGDDTDDYLGMYKSDRSIVFNAHVLSSDGNLRAQNMFYDQYKQVGAENIYWHEKLIRNTSVKELIAKRIRLGKEPFEQFRESSNSIDDLGRNEAEITAHLENIATWVKTVHTFIHEELHAITDTVKRKNSSVNSYQRAIGFNVEIEKQADVFREADGIIVKEHYTVEQGRGINEAITQLISLRMTKAYLKQCPRDSFEQKYAYQILQEAKVGYTNEMCVTEQYITLISTLSDVPEDIVLNGLWSEYLKNGAYLPDAFVELLQENLPTVDGEDWEWLADSLRTQLSASEFPVNSGFYEVLTDIIGLLSPEKQEEIRGKLTTLNIKYFGDIENDSGIVENRTEQ